MAWAATPPIPATALQTRTARLLHNHRADLLATIDLMRRLGGAVRRLSLPLVPTHGDPNPANFLVDRDGRIHLVDWGQLALGPRERDLTFFTGHRFEEFLKRYLAAAPHPPLSLDLFAFYFYRWTLQEIADYATRILIDEAEPEVAEHAWAELEPYLPIDHAGIRRGTDEVRRVIGRCRAGGVPPS